MVAEKKPLYEEFARFFESPTREGLRELLRYNIGEIPNLDFKGQWPAFPKLARHLLGLGNSGGGCIVVGVAEREDKSLEPVGLQMLTDKTDLIDGVKKFLPNALLVKVNVLDFAFDASEYQAIVGKKFQVVLVEDDPSHLPFVATNGGEGIRNNSIYVRRGVSTEEANYEELQRIINRRLDTGYSSQREIDLQTHLEQLKVLFAQVDRYLVRAKGAFALAQKIVQEFPGVERKRNPAYPAEDFQAFIVRMIEAKKNRIESELDVAD